MSDPITEHALRIARAEGAAVERACEQALQGGVCGVMVIREQDGSLTVGPHPDVLYGMIHRYPHGRDAKRG